MTVQLVSGSLFLTEQVQKQAVLLKSSEVYHSIDSKCMGVITKGSTWKINSKMLCTAWSQSSVGPWLSEQWSLTYKCILSVKDHTTKSSGSALNSCYSCFAHKLFKPHCLCPQHQPQAFNAGHLLRAAPLQHRHHGWRWNGRLFWCWGKHSETLELEAALKRPKSDRAKKAKTHTHTHWNLRLPCLVCASCLKKVLHD